MLRYGKVSKAFRAHITKQRAAIAARRLEAGLLDDDFLDGHDSTKKSEKNIFISIDEACSHVNQKHFRSAAALSNGHLQATAFTQGMRIMSATC